MTMQVNPILEVIECILAHCNSDKDISDEELDEISFRVEVELRERVAEQREVGWTGRQEDVW